MGFPSESLQFRKFLVLPVSVTECNTGLIGGALTFQYSPIVNCGFQIIIIIMTFIVHVSCVFHTYISKWWEFAGNKAGAIIALLVLNHTPTHHKFLAWAMQLYFSISSIAFYFILFPVIKINEFFSLESTNQFKTYSLIWLLL